MKAKLTKIHLQEFNEDPIMSHYINKQIGFINS